MGAEEVSWEVAGARIAGKRWRNGDLPVLALHGWLDNAASFDALAPLLRGADVVALDMSGHGLSAHRPPQATYNIWDDLPDILRVADQLGWQRFHLLGHSRGALVSALLTAALPERIAGTVMLDALQTPAVPIADTFQQLGKFLRDHVYARRGISRYDDPERALQVRCEVAGMSERAARPIVERGLEQVDGAWQWRADPRLHFASAIKLSEQHNALLLTQLAQRPHRILLADKGVGRTLRIGGVLGRHPELNWEILPGSHHFHLEEAAPGIAERVVEFWAETVASAALDAAE